MDKKKVEELNEKCVQIRRMVIETIGSLGTGHIGGSLSITEVLVVLYYALMKIDPRNPRMEGRDRFVLSKGHAGPGLYAVLADMGYFGKEHLSTLNRPGTILPSHCDQVKTPGIDMVAGSLGQGFSCAAGMALASRLKNDGAYIYAIVGDGESQEGQIWETAMYAGAQRLNNFIAFTDYNKMQLDGMVDDIVTLQPLKDKWEAFNWNVINVKDGNDIEEIYKAIISAKAIKDKPSMIILNTVKGKGISFIEDAGYHNHSMSISPEMVQMALEELEGKRGTGYAG